MSNEINVGRLFQHLTPDPCKLIPARIVRLTGKDPITGARYVLSLYLPPSRPLPAEPQPADQAK